MVHGRTGNKGGKPGLQSSRLMARNVANRFALSKRGLTRPYRRFARFFENRRFSNKAAAQHQLHPGAEELQENPAQMLRAEELALTIFTGVMVHGNFDHPATAHLAFLDQLHANHAAVAGEPKSREDPAAKQPEITIQYVGTRT